jgi:carbon monoxide dehydrogenase subunit G
LDLKHTFTVPAGIDETWSHFQDIESVAGCFPGATVTEVDGDDFKGSAKVKLGPIALVYNGTGHFVEKDEAARKFVLEAKGKDKRGNGTAGATVTATFAEEGADSTTVEVVTDLAITGKPAQFGRGVIQDVSDKLLQQFVDCLQQQVGSSGSSGSSGEVDASPESVAEPVSEPVPDSAPSRPSPEAVAAPSRTSAPRPVPQQDDALDLGATVLPVLARTYWKQALGVLVVLFVLTRVVRRILR